ncbi:M28 family peptidase [Desulfobulbus alkaliphilus]|nr:M28 family peptidase [Desulfobulbus alkaliphilus]
MTDLRFDKDISKQRIEQHLYLLTKEIGERSVRRWENHAQTRDALEEIFQRIGLRTTLETYDYKGTPVANVIGEINPGKHSTQRYLVGAHYDSVAGTVGADDNASGVAVLLELAEVLQENRNLLDPSLSIRLVAFALEEPPVFSTSYMGSKVHASAMKANQEQLTGMICLEMVGYTCHREGCQSYPFPLQFMKYPKKGDFIGIVGNFRSRKFTAALMDAFSNNPALPAITLSVPFNGWLMPAIRLSDHAPFWDQGFKAVMITDTAFYRNPHYHLSSDTMETLDIDFMAELVRSLLLFFLAADSR